MPELPEVETIRRQLENQVIGKKIKSISFSDKHLRRPIPKKDLSSCLPGCSIVRVDRKGKYLLFLTDNGQRVCLHLGMSGRLLFDDAPSKEKHCHFIISFKDKKALSYIDPRRFGQLDFSKGEEGLLELPVSKLGPEPFSYDPKEMMLRMSKTKRAIKDFLLDQTQIAGLGNIYVCEALFLTGIDPRERTNNNKAKGKELLKNIEQVLIKGIKNSGTTFSDYRDLTGLKGLNQEGLWVFRREGMPCFKCNAEIIRVKQGGRSSFLCPFCQK